MSIPRFWWIDNSDHQASQARLRKYREDGPLKSWDWSRWSEGDYENPDEAFRQLVCQIGTPPMFGDGKVVCCYGVPSTQAKVAKELCEIPERVMLVVVARPDARTSLYKTAKKLGDKAKVDEPLRLDKREDAAAWAKSRAESMDLKAVDKAIAMLVELVGTNPSRLASELAKLKYLTDDGTLHPWVVQEGCCGTGESSVYEMGECLANKDFGMAHEHMRRLLERGEPPLKVCGYLMDWVQKMAMAEACGGRYGDIKENVAKLRKYKKPDKSLADRLVRLHRQLEAPKDAKAAAKVQQEIGRVKKKMKEPPPPMFPKPGALYHSCERYNRIGYPRGWAYFLLKKLGDLQVELRRRPGDGRKLMHRFLAKFEEYGNAR